MSDPGNKVRRAPAAIACAALAGLGALCLAQAFGAETAEKLVEEKPAPPPELTGAQVAAEDVRELKFTKPLAYKPLKRDEVVQFIEQQVRKEYEPQEWEDLLLAAEKLGLVKSAEGLTALLVRSYASELVACYDHHTHTVHLIEDLPMPKLMYPIAEVHELVHALQDQHFDLSSLPLDDTRNSDRAMAAMALVEGDATLATVQYAREHARLSLLDTVQFSAFVLQPGVAAPYLFRRQTKFVYFDGLRLAQALYDQDDWNAINKAYEEPPASTEQVLHYKAKYLDERDEPTPVELPDCAPLLGEGWRLAADDVLGELGVQVLFRQHLSFLRAGRPSRGWDGDRFHFYRPAKGDAFALVWLSVWDTPRDAQEFTAAYRKVLLRKLRADEGAAARDERVFLVSGKDRVAVLHVEGERVLTVEAPSATMARSLRKHVLAAAKVGTHTAEEEPGAR